MPRLKAAAQLARPALETVVELLRDSSDWNPFLKAAAGGLVNVLKTLRLAEGNDETLSRILGRIASVSNALANDRDCVVVKSRVQQVETVMLNLATRLQDLRRRRGGKLFAALLASDEAGILSDCERELDTAIGDTNFTLGVSQATRVEANHDRLMCLLHRISNDQQQHHNADQTVQTLVQLLAERERESKLDGKWAPNGRIRLAFQAEFPPAVLFA